MDYYRFFCFFEIKCTIHDNKVFSANSNFALYMHPLQNLHGIIIFHFASLSFSSYLFVWIHHCFFFFVFWQNENFNVTQNNVFFIENFLQKKRYIRFLFLLFFLLILFSWKQINWITFQISWKNRCNSFFLLLLSSSFAKQLFLQNHNNNNNNKN